MARSSLAASALALAAAQHFPGGPVMLVFALFWAPVGPGIPAGVLNVVHGDADETVPHEEADVLNAAQRWADDEIRSLNAQIEYVLRDALRKAGRLPAPPPAKEEEQTDGE